MLLKIGHPWPNCVAKVLVEDCCLDVVDMCLSRVRVFFVIAVRSKQAFRLHIQHLQLQCLLKAAADVCTE